MKKVNTFFLETKLQHQVGGRVFNILRWWNEIFLQLALHNQYQKSKEGKKGAESIQPLSNMNLID